MVLQPEALAASRPAVDLEERERGVSLMHFDLFLELRSY